MNDYELHAVIIKKPIDLNEAKLIASRIINNKNRKFFRETSESYRFRNLPKQKFIKTSFRTKIINPQISLVFGQLNE